MEAICFNCNAHWDLHHYETLQCPKNGIEARTGTKQQWEIAVFRDPELQNISQQRDELLEASKALINHMGKGWESNPLLVVLYKNKLKAISKAIKNCK